MALANGNMLTCLKKSGPLEQKKSTHTLNMFQLTTGSEDKNSREDEKKLMMSPSTKLMRPGGAPVAIKDLVHGDDLLAFSVEEVEGKHGRVVPGSFGQYTMLGWLARSMESVTFIRFKTKGKRQMAVTVNHYIWVMGGNKMEIASNVQRGESIPFRKEDGTVGWDEVVEIESITETGGFDPVVFNGSHPGDMVVTANGLMVPIYANLWKFPGFRAHEAHKLFADLLQDSMTHKDEYSCLFDNVPNKGMLLVEILAQVLKNLGEKDYSDDETYNLKWLSSKMQASFHSSKDLQELLAQCPKFAESKDGISSLQHYTLSKQNYMQE